MIPIHIMINIVPTPLDEYRPNLNRKPSPDEVALLEFSCGFRNCTDNFLDRTINYYLVSIGGVVTFIILSLEPVDRGLAELIPNKIRRLIFKAVIFFVVIYLLDRWVESWRQRVTICNIGL